MLTHSYRVAEKKDESFLFSNKLGEPDFNFHCVIVNQGIIDSNRAGQYL